MSETRQCLAQSTMSIDLRLVLLGAFSGSNQFSTPLMLRSVTRYLSPEVEYMALTWALGPRVSSMNAWASSAYFAFSSWVAARWNFLANTLRLAAVFCSRVLVSTLSSPRSLKHKAVASATTTLVFFSAR